jgi:hypothetical protein
VSLPAGDSGFPSALLALFGGEIAGARAPAFSLLGGRGDECAGTVGTADRKKPTRASYAERPGAWCYYMTPPRLVRADELPDGWGLLEVSDAARATVRVIVQPKPEYQIDDRTAEQMRREVERLYQEVRRYQAQGLKYKTWAAIHERKDADLLLLTGPAPAQRAQP